MDDHHGCSGYYALRAGNVIALRPVVILLHQRRFHPVEVHVDERVIAVLVDALDRKAGPAQIVGQHICDNIVTRYAERALLPGFRTEGGTGGLHVRGCGRPGCGLRRRCVRGAIARLRYERRHVLFGEAELAANVVGGEGALPGHVVYGAPTDTEHLGHFLGGKGVHVKGYGGCSLCVVTP